MSWCRIRYFQEKTDSSLVSLTVRLFGSDNAQVEELIWKLGNKTPILLFFGGKSSKQLEMIICFDFKLLSSMATNIYISPPKKHVGYMLVLMPWTEESSIIATKDEDIPIFHLENPQHDHQVVVSKMCFLPCSQVLGRSFPRWWAYLLRWDGLKPPTSSPSTSMF